MKEKVVKSKCIDCKKAIFLFKGSSGRCTDCFDKAFLAIVGYRYGENK